ncbi:hypothetical protein SEEE2651_24996 [Salmonella enterica subsp. enterica serovar Enteritidis str. 76-2651]|nr:hypothetical protein SEEE2651_24996 [Salmonella enterica subsp. enterica serovar Enteritidis str. 76-2651]
MPVSVIIGIALHLLVKGKIFLALCLLYWP